MASLSVGIAIDMGKFWRELGTVRTALADLSTQQNMLGIGVQTAPVGGGGGASGGGGGGSSLLKDIATAAIAAKAAAGTIASPFLSLRVEMRAMGVEMSGAMAQSADEMERAGGYMKAVAEESAVQAGRARQEDMERFAAERRAIAESKAASAAKRSATTTRTNSQGVTEIVKPSAFQMAMAGIQRVQAGIATLRAKGADLEVNMIRNTREIGVAMERLGKIGGVLTAPLRATIGITKTVVGMFGSYEDRVGRVAKRMGLLESATKAAASVASAPFKAANAASAAIGRMGMGAAVAAGAVAAGMGVAIKAGSDLNETLSKVDTVFGDASGGVKADADEMANKFGVPKNTFLDSAASIGLIGKAAGQSEAEAAKFGSQFSKLSLDMMSFYNVPVDEAMKAVRSGLVGEAEPMRRFGVLLSEDRVEAEALRMGLIQTGEEMTEQQKVQARSSLIMKGLGDAQGDLARTANAPANLMRTLGGRLTNVASTIGQAVLPGVQSFLQLLNEMAIDAENGSGGVVAAFEWVGGMIKSTVDVIATIYRNWGDYQDILAATVEARMVNIGEVASWLQSVFWTVLDWIAQNYTTILPDAFEAVKTALMNLGENIKNFFSELWAWIKSGGKDPIEFELVPLMKGANFQSGEFVMPELKLTGPDQDRIDAANERINKRETDRANNMKAAEKAKRGSTQEESLAEEEGKKKSNLGQKLDLAAFRDQLQQGLFDKDKKRQIKAAEDAAGAAKENVKEVKGLREDLKKAKGGLA